jgi:hypothetical protein
MEITKATPTNVFDAVIVVVEAVHGLPIPPPEVGWALVSGVAWCLAFLLVASLVFERRDFR